MATVPHEERPDVLAWRVAKNSEKLEELEKWRREVDIERASNREILLGIKDDVRTLNTSVKATQRVFISLLATIAGGAVLALITVLVGTGRL